MKTIKAFAVSLLLCALTIVGLHLYSGRGFSAEGKAGKMCIRDRLAAGRFMEGDGTLVERIHHVGE